MNIPFIDLRKQHRLLGKEIRKSLKGIFENSNFILGREVELFEKEFAGYCGAKYCLGVNSGTSALHLALLGAGVGPGDEVILQPNTFFATAAAVSYVGAKPVFVDINPQTYNLDARKIEKVITKKTRCILPVHLYGNLAPMPEILKIARRYGLIVIEDACQAHGMKNFLGKLACFSFYPGKVLGAAGEGGAVITNDKSLYQKIKALRDHGQVRKHHHQLIGYNYRMESIQGAILRVKLKKLPEWIEKRKKRAELYNNLLPDTIKTPQTDSSNFQYYVIRCKNRDKLKDYLAENGVYAQIHYPVPIHLQPAFSFLGYKKGDFPETEKACREILSLPFWPEITLKQQKYVAQKIKEFYQKYAL